jgi:CubicO group peptidase (beta-lactamase class C family)
VNASGRNALRVLALLGAALAGAVWTAQRLGYSSAPAQVQGVVTYATAPASAARYAEAVESARQVALDILGRGVPGLAAAVAVDGQIVWAEGFGYADVENRVPVWPTTRFRIGSVSKPVTAAAVARLVEEEKLDLDAPVQRYVPGFPQKGHVITTRQLAGHLAGIRHYRGDEFLLARRYNTVLEGLAIFQDDPLLHPPGTRFLYSSYGWNLVSAVVEGAAGKDFLSYMEEAVFAPLGMRSTVADFNNRIIFQRTRFYARDREGRLLNAPYVDNSYKWAGGGFLSTVEDLARFGSAHLGAGFFRQATLDLLFTSQRDAEGKETNYGIGWNVEKDSKGRRRAAHGGGSVGGTAMLILYPESKVVVAVLANLSNAPFRRADFERLAEPFMK